MGVVIDTYQPLSLKMYPRALQDLKRRTEIIPVKDSHTRINPFKNKTVGFGQRPRPRPLHNRYSRTDIFVRWEMAVTYSRYKFVTASLPKRLLNGRFASETAVRRFRK
jgi:hypothetical protein